MATAVTLLLIGCLLQGSLCGQFEVTVPQIIEVLSGSCVTIPCSFDIEDKFKSDLDITCRALWFSGEKTAVFDSNDPQQSNTIEGELTGDLRKKDCTTTLNNLQSEHSNKYFFRLQCENALKYNYNNKEHFQTYISVKADPPRPTLTPSTVLVSEEAPVSLTCSAPAPCLSRPPTLTWTSSLGDGQEKLQENQDKTKVKTSVLTFTAHHLNLTKEIACTAVYNKQDGSTESSVSITANITFAPQILPSSVCTKATDHLNCSCETAGNPSPTLRWYLDGLPVNHSDNFTISNEPLNDAGLRSIITLGQPRWRDISTLVCHSSNSLGSATGRFYFYSLEPQTCGESQDLVMLTVFITTVVALVCVILGCALLLVIRAQKTHHILPKSAVTMSQLITSEEESEVPNKTEEDIYVNASMTRQADAAYPAAISEANSIIFPSSGPNNAEGASKSSEEKEGGSDVVYSAVNWKSTGKKKKGETAMGMDQPGRSYFEEERCTYRNFVDNALEMGNIYDVVEPRNVNKEVECEYARVKFKNKNVMHK